MSVASWACRLVRWFAVCIVLVVVSIMSSAVPLTYRVCFRSWGIPVHSSLGPWSRVEFDPHTRQTFFLSV